MAIHASSLRCHYIPMCRVFVLRSSRSRVRSVISVSFPALAIATTTTGAQKVPTQPFVLRDPTPMRPADIVPLSRVVNHSKVRPVRSRYSLTHHWFIHACPTSPLVHAIPYIPTTVDSNRNNRAPRERAPIASSVLIPSWSPPSPLLLSPSILFREGVSPGARVWPGSIILLRSRLFRRQNPIHPPRSPLLTLSNTSSPKASNVSRARPRLRRVRMDFARTPPDNVWFESLWSLGACFHADLVRLPSISSFISSLIVRHIELSFG